MTKMHDVSELYYPEQNATGYFLTGIAEGITAEWHSTVSVLLIQPSYNAKGHSRGKATLSAPPCSLFILSKRAYSLLRRAFSCDKSSSDTSGEYEDLRKCLAVNCIPRPLFT